MPLRRPEDTETSAAIFDSRNHHRYAVRRTPWCCLGPTAKFYNVVMVSVSTH